MEAFACEAAKSIKTESDLDDFRKVLTKVTVETAFNPELDEHPRDRRYIQRNV